MSRLVRCLHPSETGSPRRGLTSACSRRRRAAESESHGRDVRAFAAEALLVRPMMMKYPLTIFAAVALSICASPLSCGEEPSDEIWVSIAANIKGVGMPMSEYYGALDRKVFEETLTRTLPSGFLKLRHVA